MGEESELRRVSWWIAPTIALLAIAVSVVQEWWCPPFASRCSEARPRAKIISPRDDVEREQEVTGTSDDIPDEHALWVVLYIPSVDRFYPADFPARIDAEGNWSAPLLIGQESERGMTFEILVLSANGDAQASFQTYLERSRIEGFAGLPALPAGTRVLDRIEVLRR